MRGVSGSRGAEVRLPVRPGATSQQPGERGERAADWDERECVRKVAVELGVEERVGAAANQRVNVGQQRPGDTGEPGRPSQRARKNDPRRRRAEERMRERIHGVIVLRLQTVASGPRRARPGAHRNCTRARAGKATLHARFRSSPDIGPVDDAALHAPESGRARQRDSVA